LLGAAVGDQAVESGERVLVTGATGFTGGVLARLLRARGRHVRVLVRDLDGAARLADEGFELACGDLTDARAVDRAVSGCERIYHVAATFRTVGHPDTYYHAVNAGGVENVLAAARNHGAERSVIVSTAGVHGGVERIPSDENAPYRAGDIYQESKLAGERIALNAITSGQPVSIARPTGIFGPGDLRFLKLFRAIDRGRFRMFGSGEVMVHLSHVDDVAAGIALCGEHPEAEGEVFLIGGTEYCTLNELVAKIASALGVEAPRGHLPMWPLLMAARLCESVCVPLGVEPPLHTRRCEFFVKPRAFSIDKAKRRLGFEPQNPLDRSLRETAQWYFDQGHLKPR
jgi:dihydroflavonol-4-reductase